MTDSALIAAPFGDYQPRGLDESVDERGVVRRHWTPLAEAFGELGTAELARRSEEIALLLAQDGVTYNVRDDVRPQRPWLVDPIPLVVPGDEWSLLQRGVEQRARLLDEVLSDLYGERRLIRSGLIPAAMIFQDEQFLRPCDGIRLPSARQLINAAIDVVHTPDGWQAIGNRTQAPSGAAYAMETRRVVSRVFPRVFRESAVERLAPFLRTLRSALRSAAPPGIDDPTVVILSPGSRSETAFEHASIAALLGYPLVEGADLEVHEGQVNLRTIGGLVPVHVILRRVDAWFCDPLELRADSTLGVPGLVEACRTGAVSVVNPLGSGILENAGLMGLLPMLGPEILGEELLLHQAESWWCGDSASRSHVIANLGDLVVRPLSRAGLEHAVDTAHATTGELDDLRRRIEARPDGWVGQRRLQPSTLPVMSADGVFEPRSSVVRVFAVSNGDGYDAMAGGLGRAAGPDSTIPIANRSGALAKDVWVLGAGAEAEHAFWLAPSDDAVSAGQEVPAARAAEHLFWLGRHVERAEATVRLLRAATDRRGQAQDVVVGPTPAALAVLLESLTHVTGTFPGSLGIDLAVDDPGPEMASLLLDSGRPGSVAHAVAQVFESINVVRDQLSVDTWLVAGSLQQVLDAAGDPSAHDDDDFELSAVLDHLLPGLLSFAGLGSESLVRDHSWRFMDAGRRIERALLVSTMVANALGWERSPAVESLVIESVLTAGESIITYRRRYRSQAQVARVIDLLVLDSQNPRSVRYQLVEVLERLAELRNGLRPDDEPSETERELARLIAELDEVDSNEMAMPGDDGHRARLTAAMSAMGATLREASDAIANRYFMRIAIQRAIVTPVDPSVGASAGVSAGPS